MDDKSTIRLSVRFTESDFAIIERYAKNRRILPTDVIRMGTIAFLQAESMLPVDKLFKKPMSSKAAS